MLKDPNVIWLDSGAISAASACGHVEVVKMLLADSRVDPSSEDNAAIREASENGHVEVVRELTRQEVGHVVASSESINHCLVMLYDVQVRERVRDSGTIPTGTTEHRHDDGRAMSYCCVVPDQKPFRGDNHDERNVSRIVRERVFRDHDAVGEGSLTGSLPSQTHLMSSPSTCSRRCCFRAEAASSGEHRAGRRRARSAEAFGAGGRPGRVYSRTEQAGSRQAGSGAGR